MKPEEEHLVAACRRRDPQACRQLYDTYAPAMLGVCMSLLKDRDKAQDALHDGFIKVFEKLHQLRSNDVLAPWIRRIMVNTATDRLRLDRRLASLDAVDDNTAADPHWDDRLDRFGPEDIALAIQQLPEFNRTVFTLFELEGYTDQELAQRFGIKPSSVRSHVCRARKQLIETLTKQ